MKYKFIKFLAMGTLCFGMAFTAPEFFTQDAVVVKAAGEADAGSSDASLAETEETLTTIKTFIDPHDENVVYFKKNSAGKIYIWKANNDGTNPHVCKDEDVTERISDTLEYYYRAKSDGTMAVNEWAVQGSGINSYFDENGKQVRDKLFKIGDYDYYFQHDGSYRVNWLCFSDKTNLDWYFDKDGHLVKGKTLMLSTDVKDPYNGSDMDKDGQPDERYLDGKYYFTFDENGYGAPATNMVYMNPETNKLCYFNLYGKMEDNGFFKFEYDPKPSYEGTQASWDVDEKNRLGFANQDGSLVTNKKIIMKLNGKTFYYYIKDNGVGFQSKRELVSNGGVTDTDPMVLDYGNPLAEVNTASSGRLTDKIKWTLDEDGTLNIVGEGAMPDYSDDVDGAFDGSTNIKKVIIGDGVTSIGKYNFWNLRNLESVSISSSVKSIGEGAFCQCKKLNTIIIPSSVTKICAYAFRDADSLKDIYYSGSEDDFKKIDVDKAENENSRFFDANVTYNAKMFINPNNDSIYAWGVRTSDNEVIVYKDGKLDSNEFFSDGEYTYYCQADGTLMKNQFSYHPTENHYIYFDEDGHELFNTFKGIGKDTYFFQSNGAPMSDQLTYHPDGKHVIYFDEEGHEVFNAFTHVSKSISGDAVDDYCYFNVFGYMYVNTVTYDSKGSKLYYINEYGQLQHSGWFKFDKNAGCGDTDTTWKFTGSYIGYANYDGTLMKDQATYDWNGTPCYMQGNGEALYETTDNSSNNTSGAATDNTSGAATANTSGAATATN